MAGIGDSWGTEQELLHPRGPDGRWIPKAGIAKSIFSAVLDFLRSFRPRSFQNHQQASQYAHNLSLRSGRKRMTTRDHARLFDLPHANEDLRDGVIDNPSTKRFVEMMDRTEIELPDDVVLTRVVGVDAFGFTPETAVGTDSFTDPGIRALSGKLAADRGYSLTHLGDVTAPAGPVPAGAIRMIIAARKGTKVNVSGANPNDSTVFLTRDQPLRITKIKPDGAGGWHMYVTAEAFDDHDVPIPIAGPRGAGQPTPKEREAQVADRISSPRQKSQPGVAPGDEAELADEEARRQAIEANKGVTPVPSPQAEAERKRVEQLQQQAGVQPRNEPIVSPSIGGEPRPATGPGGQPQGQAPGAPEAPVTPNRSVDLRRAVRDAGVPAPAAGPNRKRFNDAYEGVISGKKDPIDAVRELDRDAADLEANGDQDADNLRQLADVIRQQYGLEEGPRSAGPDQKPGAPVEAPPAAKKVAKKAAPGGMTPDQEDRVVARAKEFRGGERNEEEERIVRQADEILARRQGGAPVKKAVPAKKAAPATAPSIEDEVKDLFGGRRPTNAQLREMGERNNLGFGPAEPRSEMIRAILGARPSRGRQRGEEAVTPPVKKVAPAKKAVPKRRDDLETKTKSELIDIADREGVQVSGDPGEEGLRRLIRNDRETQTPGDDLDKMTKAELLAEAERREIATPKSWTKDKIKALMREEEFRFPKKKTPEQRREQDRADQKLEEEFRRLEAKRDAEPPAPVKKAAPSRVVDLVRPDQTPEAPAPVKKTALRKLNSHNLNPGDRVIWERPGEAPVHGVVDQQGTRTFVQWEGGRRERVTSTGDGGMGPDVRLATPEEIEAHGTLGPPREAPRTPATKAAVPGAAPTPGRIDRVGPRDINVGDEILVEAGPSKGTSRGRVARIERSGGTGNNNRYEFFNEDGEMFRSMAPNGKTNVRRGGTAPEPGAAPAKKAAPRRAGTQVSDWAGVNAGLLEPEVARSIQERLDNGENPIQIARNMGLPSRPLNGETDDDRIRKLAWDSIRDRLVAMGTPEGPGDEAIIRQARLDQGRRVGKSLADFDRAIGNQASDRALEHTIRANGRRHSLPQRDVDDMVQAGLSRDPEAIRAVMDRISADSGVRLVGRNGETSTLDRRRHEVTGGGSPTHVEVSRAGVEMDDGDGTPIVLEKAQVHGITPQEHSDARHELTPEERAVDQAQRLVPEGSVEGTRAQTPVTNAPRKRGLQEAWDAAGIEPRPGPVKRQTDEIKGRLLKGEITPEESIRLMEAEIAFNKEDLTELDAHLRESDLGPTERAEFNSRAIRLTQDIKEQEKAAKFLRQYFKEEAPVVSIKELKETDPVSFEFLKDAKPDDMREAAKEAGLDPPSGETVDEMFTDLLKQVAKKELDRQAAKKVAKKAPAKVAKKVAPPAPAVPKEKERVDARLLAEGLDLDDDKIIDLVQRALDGEAIGGTGKNPTPRQIADVVDGHARALTNSTVIRFGNWDGPGILGGERDPEDRAQMRREHEAGIARAEAIKKLAERVRGVRRRSPKKAAPVKATPEVAKLQDKVDDLEKRRIDDAIAELGQSGDNRNRGDAALEGLTMPELRRLAAQSGVGTARTKRALRDKILDRFIGEPEPPTPPPVSAPEPEAPIQFTREMRIGARAKAAGIEPPQQPFSGVNDAEGRANQMLQAGASGTEVARMLRERAAQVAKADLIEEGRRFPIEYNKDSLREMRKSSAEYLRRLATMLQQDEKSQRAPAKKAAPRAARLTQRQLDALDDDQILPAHESGALTKQRAAAALRERADSIASVVALQSLGGKTDFEPEHQQRLDKMRADVVRLRTQADAIEAGEIASSTPDPEQSAPDRQADIDSRREVEVENRIRAAYRAALVGRSERLEGQGPAFVSLADIRDALSDLSRDEQDDAIDAIRRQDGVRAIPIHNTKGLTGREFEAALHVPRGDRSGIGTPLHVISIADPSDRPLPTGDGEKVRLSKAVVEEVDAPDEALERRVEELKKQRDAGPKAEPGRSPAPDMATRQTQLADIVSGEEKEKRRLGGGSSYTHLVTFDGGTAVHKDQSRSRDPQHEQKRTTDAEELGSLVVDAVGLRAPATKRDGDTQIYLEHMPGKTGSELVYDQNTDPVKLLAGIVPTRQGRLLGLADALMLNGDRATGNWIMNDDELIPIDHGLAFAFTTPAGASASPFARHLTTPDGFDWTDTNDYHPEDMATIRARLEALRAQFEALGRGAWWKAMMKRFEVLSKAAKGTERLL